MTKISDIAERPKYHADIRTCLKCGRGDHVGLTLDNGDEVNWCCCGIVWVSNRTKGEIVYNFCPVVGED